MKKLGIAALAVASLAMGGCASTNQHGQECVVGQTCGIFTSEVSGKVFTNVKVLEIIEKGSARWNKSIEVASITFNLPKSQVLSEIGDRDIVTLRRLGFGRNLYGWAAADGLKIGDVVDYNSGKVGAGVLPHIVRVVKRAGE